MNHPSNRAERLRLKSKHEQKKAFTAGKGKRVIKEKLEQAELAIELKEFSKEEEAIQSLADIV